MHQILGVTDTLLYVVYFEQLRETIVAKPSIQTGDLVKEFYEHNPHSIRRVVLQIEDPLEQINYFDAIKKAILESPKMSTVDLVKTFLSNHPDTINGAKVAVNLHGTIRLMRRSEIEEAGLTVLDPTKNLAEQLKLQIESQPNVDDTNLRDSDSREDVHTEP